VAHLDRGLIPVPSCRGRERCHRLFRSWRERRGRRGGFLNTNALPQFTVPPQPLEFQSPHIGSVYS